MLDAITSCIEQMESNILELESGSASTDQLVSVLSTLGITHLKLPSAQLITLFDMLTDGIQPVTPELVTSLLGVCEAQKRMLYAMAGFVTDKSKEISELREQQQDQPESGMDAADEAMLAAAASEGVVSSEEFAEFSESLAAKAPEETRQEETPQAEQKIDEAPASANKAPAAKAEGNGQAKGKRDGIVSVRVNTEKLDNLIEWVGKLMVTYAVISQNKNLDSGTIAGLREMDQVIDQIKREVDGIRLVPLKQIFMPLHRLVTSTAQKINKKIELTVQGDDLELDKMIVENLNEPLVHMLRNAVDHGVEGPEDRELAGKSPTGHVHLRAWRSGDSAYISIKDDGRGLDPERIRKKADEKGLLNPEYEYTDEELYQFIMASGFSTAEQVTDISGRGVGMDAVVNAVREQLGGDVKVESTLGEGTRFIISIPLDRSVNEGIVDALITRAGKETFIIPSRDVVEVFSATSKDTIELPDGSVAVNVRGEVHPLISLCDYFKIPSQPSQDGYLHTIVVNVGSVKAALLIDEVISQQQAVVTGFTIPVQDIYQIPILGYGMLGETNALVVDVENLIERLSADESSVA